NNPSPAMVTEYITYIKGSHNLTGLTSHLLEISPFLNDYMALLQNFHIQNIIEYIQQTPCPAIALDWIRETLQHMQ
ncbi:hypothetical protein PAXRUDRAFT_152159, partial [Paxillus rubicundulus Ve08.2h10]